MEFKLDKRNLPWLRLVISSAKNFNDIDHRFERRMSQLKMIELHNIEVTVNRYDWFGEF